MYIGNPIDETINKYLGYINPLNYEEKVKELLSSYPDLVLKYKNILPDKTLRDYQIATLILFEVFNEKSQLCVLPTGAGKTEIFIAYIKANLDKFRKVFILVPRKELLTQTKARLLKYFDEKIIGELSSDIIDVEDKKIIVTLDTSLVFEKSKEKQAIFLENLKDALVVIDEFHNFGAKKKKAFLEKLIYEKSDYFKQKLMFTATPIRTDKVDIFRFATFIPITLDIITLIDKGYLSPFYEHNLILEFDEKFSFSDLQKIYEEIENKNYEFKDTQIFQNFAKNLSSFIKEHKFTVIFVSKIKVAKALKIALEEEGLKGVVFSSELNKREREEIFKNLKEGKYSFAISVNLLNEGIDIPFIDAMVIIRPFRTISLFIQSLGRGLRKAENKTHLDVLYVDCVYKMLDKKIYLRSAVYRHLALDIFNQLKFFLSDYWKLEKEKEEQEENFVFKKPTSFSLEKLKKTKKEKYFEFLLSTLNPFKNLPLIVLKLDDEQVLLADKHELSISILSPSSNRQIIKVNDVDMFYSYLKRVFFRYVDKELLDEIMKKKSSIKSFSLTDKERFFIDYYYEKYKKQNFPLSFFDDQIIYSLNYFSKRTYLTFIRNFYMSNIFSKYDFEYLLYYSYDEKFYVYDNNRLVFSFSFLELDISHVVKFISSSVDKTPNYLYVNAQLVSNYLKNGFLSLNEAKDALRKLFLTSVLILKRDIKSKTLCYINRKNFLLYSDFLVIPYVKNIFFKGNVPFYFFKHTYKPITSLEEELKTLFKTYFSFKEKQKQEERKFYDKISLKI